MLSHELRMVRSAHHTYPSVRRKKNYSSRINRLTEVNGIYIISLHLSILPFVGSCERPNGIRSPAISICVYIACIGRFYLMQWPSIYFVLDCHLEKQMKWDQQTDQCTRRECLILFVESIAQFLFRWIFFFFGRTFIWAKLRGEKTPSNNYLHRQASQLTQWQIAIHYHQMFAKV